MSITITLEDAVNYWDRDAGNWVLKRHPLLACSAQRKSEICHALSAFAYLKEARDLLDVGSASEGVCGYFDNIILPHFVVAMDYSPEMLRINPSRRKLLADANACFPFADNSFNAVTQFFLNRYLRDPVRNAQELGRVTKQGGVILIMDHTYIGHQLEVREFNPLEIENSLKKVCRAAYTIEVSPAFSDPEFTGHRGPIYLVIGVK